MNVEALSTSPQDQQLVALLLEGHNNGEIGLHLGLAEQVVKNRLRLLYFRAGIESGSKRVKLVQMLSAQSEKQPLPKLSPLEQKIAQLAISGSSNRQIAVELKLTYSTVKIYMSSIFDKCGVWGRTELAARFRCA